MASIVFRFPAVFPASPPSRWRSHGGELALYVGFYLVYLLSRGLVFEGDRQALANADRVISLQGGIGLFVEPAVQQWAINHAQPLVVFLNWVYIVTYWPVILVIALYLYLTRRFLYIKYRTLIAVHLCLALLLFVVFPVAPPFKTGLLADTIQLYGPGFYGSEAMAFFYNTNAAIPSLHFSWTCILAWLFLRECEGWYRYLGLGYPLLTLAAIVVTGNHYLVDAVVGVASIGMAVGIISVAGRMTRKLRRPEISSPTPFSHQPASSACELDGGDESPQRPCAESQPGGICPQRGWRKVGARAGFISSRRRVGSEGSGASACASARDLR